MRERAAMSDAFATALSGAGRSGAPGTRRSMRPAAAGLYDPAREHDACGVGFVVNLRREKSHRIIQSGLQIVENLTHRGAVGADPLVGDGAGMLVQVPHRFFAAEAERLGFALPEPGRYGVGFIFMPQDKALRAEMASDRRGSDRRGRPAAHRLARRAGRQQLPVEGTGDPGDRAVPPPGLHRPRPTTLPTTTRSSASSTSCAR